MNEMVLTANMDAAGESRSIYCPAVANLTAAQSDCAIAMPRLDNNGELVATPATNKRQLAGVLCVDPFRRPHRLGPDLIKQGYAGVVNWPSSIVFNGTLKSIMNSIPASPEVEYEWLSAFQEMGLECFAFVMSMDQADAAIELGLNKLIIHPGLFQKEPKIVGSLLQDSIDTMYKSTKRQSPNAEVWLYAHPSFASFVDFEAIKADGLVLFDGST